MEYILLIIGFICMITGIIGSFLPILPGPPISWLGILLLYLTPEVKTNYWILGITLFIALSIVILDYIIPAKGTKRFGGSKYGIWGTNIGLIVGLLTPIPFGFLIGPFIGALVGELLFDKKDHNRALKAATGSLIGFLASTFMKFVVSIIYLGLFIMIIWKNSEAFF
ncbi:DUF456 family protein [Flavobacterium jejuense]|uniref:DUF456 family protein n=1 Tax=Flavobacterium jejuense TaxID=1544455 RepID=A0ABX0ISP5_9FLAO|nr:DUF456 domain-containing protein [Flavobacterium jejuense]NHN26586.1 DUF456 family protein [Flavobacterium jejuense]